MRLQSGSEWVYAFRTEEDAASPPDLAVCAAAPFAPTVKLGGGRLRALHGGRDGGGYEEGGLGDGLLPADGPDLRPGHAGAVLRALLPAGWALHGVGRVHAGEQRPAPGGVVLAGGALKLVEVPRASWAA